MNSTNKEKDKILSLVKKYYQKHHKKPEYKDGDKITYAARVYDENEMCALIDSSLEFWLTSGRFTDEFEKGLASYIGVKYCYLVNSGSSANLLAFMALTSPLLGERAIKRGDEVITVAAGFPTTVTPMLQFGAIPVFVDVDALQHNIDLTLLEKAITKKTKAVMIAHTLGNPFDVAAIKALCEKHNLWLVEDNCDALGSEILVESIYKKTGSIGDIGTSSFYPPHHMTMGEGGATYTNNPLLSKIMLSMRDWGRDCICPSGVDNRCGKRFSVQYGELPFGYDHKYVYSHFGYNLKATDMQAAIGVEQLKKLPQFVERRRENWQYLYDGLKSIKELKLPQPLENSRPSWFGFMIVASSNEQRDNIVDKLEGSKIQTRSLFAGNLIKHPCFDSIRGTDAYRVVGELKNTDTIMNNAFWVGVYPGMTKPMLDKIITTIKESF